MMTLVDEFYAVPYVSKLGLSTFLLLYGFHYKIRRVTALFFVYVTNLILNALLHSLWIFIICQSYLVLTFLILDLFFDHVLQEYNKTNLMLVLKNLNFACLEIIVKTTKSPVGFLYSLANIFVYTFSFRHYAI